MKPPTFEFLVENGVEFVDQAPDNSGGHATGISAPRENHTIWGQGQSLRARQEQAARPHAAAGGQRPQEGRQVPVELPYGRHLPRERPHRAGVLGIQASYTPTILPGTTTPLKSFRTEGNIDMTAETVTVKANKAIVIGTGGSTGNVNFRRMFDVRLTEEYPNAAGGIFPAGCQRGAGRHGRRGIALGHGQPDV